MARHRNGYLIMAMIECINDRLQTPYVMVNANMAGVRVPTQHVRNGTIVLNLRPDAIRNFTMTDDIISFNARFSQRDMHVTFPVLAVGAVYAYEDPTDGLTFAYTLDTLSAPKEPETPPPPPKRPTLSIVK